MSLIIRLEEQLGKVKIHSACIVLPLRIGSIIIGCIGLILSVCWIGYDATYLTSGGSTTVKLGLDIAFNILLLISTLLLLYGIFKSEPVLMLPFIITVIIKLTVGAVIEVMFTFLSLNLLLLGIWLLTTALLIYFFLIVSSYYMELRQGA